MKLSGYETFCLYLALKNHFTQDSYDFFKYNGKISASKDAFLRRRDRYQFEKLARKYEADDMRTFLVANILAGKTWVGDMLDEQGEEAYKSHVALQQSLTYKFASELEALLANIENPKDLFVYKSESELPLIVEEYMNGTISIYTFIILDHYIGFISKYDAKLKDHYLWDKLRSKAVKFAPFVKFDKTKITKIMKEKLC